MPTSLTYLLQIGEHCVLTKQTWTPVPKLREGGRAKELLEKVFSDITGPETVQTSHGELYTLNFIDDYSQKCWVYTSKWKSEASDQFKDWKELVKRETKETKRKVQIFHTDNGEEYSLKEFEGYLQHQGINHQVTAPYTSAQNGKVEHLHRTLFNRAWAIMSDNRFPGKLWGECVHTIAYLRDPTPTRMLKDKTPYDAYYRSWPDVSHLHELGCQAFILIQSESQPKIYDWSVEGVLVGYLLDSDLGGQQQSC